jgi:flavin reductase (DIM6/NTAB) family NADH-FMN oxidoreductase RutF
MTIDLSTVSGIQRQNWLQHAIAPRPIALVSSIDADGQVNLSPFSFFNLFSSTPPIVVFSPSRRVRDNTTKHTLENVQIVPEVVINIVDGDIVQQMSLSSCEYPKNINEFHKAGFTMQPADRVKPPRVKESKVQLECAVRQVIPLGTEGGAGNLVVCEVLLIHVQEEILQADQSMIDPLKFHQVARMGGDWYSIVGKDNMFVVEKPNVKLGIGFDLLPASIRESRILTGNQLAQLANVEAQPDIDPTFNDPHVRHIVQYYSTNPEDMEDELHRYAATLLTEGKVPAAWQVLLTLS